MLYFSIICVLVFYNNLLTKCNAWKLAFFAQICDVCTDLKDLCKHHKDGIQETDGQAGSPQQVPAPVLSRKPFFLTAVGHHCCFSTVLSTVAATNLGSGLCLPTWGPWGSLDRLEVCTCDNFLVPGCCLLYPPVLAYLYCSCTPSVVPLDFTYKTQVQRKYC